MPHSSAPRLRLVAPTTRSDHQGVITSQTSSISCTTLPNLRQTSLENCEDEEEPLGNVLQKIAFLSPNQFVGLDGLARHILRSLEEGGRGLLAASVASGSGVCLAAIAKDFTWMF